MKHLQEIIQGIRILRMEGDVSVQIKNVVFDSRQAGADDLFIAVKGTRSDGHQFIPQVISKGVKAIVCEEEPETFLPGISWVITDNSSEALGIIASAYYGNPSARFRLVGVTGTNGKTTTATLLWKLFRSLGYKAGLLSTVCNYVDGREVPSTHTTPDQLQINELFAEMLSEGCTYCFMEVSSHASDQNRIAGLTFAGAIFTNITHDHLDYHKTFDNYLAAKKKFFDRLPASAFGLVNRDDRNGLVMLQNTAALKRSFALKSLADFNAKIIESTIDGMQLRIGNDDVWTHLKGEFNAYNFLGVYGAAVLLGEPKDKVLEAMSALHEVRGRFETLKSDNNITGIVDYAHTPDALDNVLKTIQEIRGQSGAQIITVAGAGGDRDRTKRPLMGKIVGRMSDRVILTSDNPRSEDPEKILEELKAGVNITDQSRVLCLVNRKEAIRTAVMMAKPGDIILVAGKGHETYQEIAGVKHHFDDMEVLREIFATLKNQ